MKENQNEKQEQKKTSLSRFFTNTNNKWAVVLSIVLFVLITVIAVFGDVSKNKSDGSNKAAAQKEQLNIKDLQPCFLYNEAEFRANLSKLKDFGEIDIVDSPVLNLKQVTVKSSGEVFYANSTGDIVIIGVMLNTKGENLTKQAMDKISQAP